LVDDPRYFGARKTAFTDDASFPQDCPFPGISILIDSLPAGTNENKLLPPRTSCTEQT